MCGQACDYVIFLRTDGFENILRGIVLEGRAAGGRNRCRIILPEDPEDPCTWQGEEKTYYIRSTVLGGEVVVDSGGRYVYAGGVKLATLTRRVEFTGGPTGTTYDSVNFHHDDPAGISQRVTRNYPEAVLGQPSYDPNYIDPRQAEFDPMDNNVGLVTNYSPQYLPSDPNVIPIEGESPLYINGQAATVTLDGTRLSGVHLTAYINSGMIGGIMGLTQILMRQSDARFTNVRLRLFDSNRWQNWGSNMHGAIDRASMFSGLHHIRAHINYGFNANFSWGPQQTDFARRRISDSEATVLKGTITQAANNTETCRKYIKDLIEKVASNAGLKAEDIVSTNVEKLFDIVLGSRGGGKPEFGGIYLRAAKSVHSADNYWAWVGNPGFAQLNLSFGTGQGTISDRLSTPKAGMTAIHELLHVALRASSQFTSDEAYAKAAAQLAGADPPNFTYDPSQPITATNRGTNYQASEYWGERLNQACGFVSHITGKMTNHKLY